MANSIDIVEQLQNLSLQDIRYPKPILKWIGGKTQIINDVINHFPTKMKNYHEPFIGGGSVLLRLLHEIEHGNIKVKGALYASDNNKYLINLYTTIQNNPERFLDDISVLIQEYQVAEDKSSYYYTIREQFNKLHRTRCKSICYVLISQ